MKINKFTQIAKCFTALLVAILLLSTSGYTTSGQGNSVHAVLFFSPSCPHCHIVIQENLPPLLEKYEEQFVIIAINVADPQGRDVYLKTVETLQIPDDKLGVPALVIGNNYLVGSVEIPEMLPGIIENGIANNGIPYPSLPGLEDLLKTNSTGNPSGDIPALTPAVFLENPPAVARIIGEGQSPAEVSNGQSGVTVTQKTVLEKFKSDMAGNSLSVIVLIGMIASVLLVGKEAADRVAPPKRKISPWVIPGLSVVGLFVAGYLSYIEITRQEAVCGPVGNCNAVQQSEYARLFGILPIGVLGVVGYALILILWAIEMNGPASQKRLATIGIGALSLFGVLFSIYLTFLEPFVIGATCAWCLTSAVIMTLIFWASSSPAITAWKGDKKKRRKR